MGGLKKGQEFKGSCFTLESLQKIELKDPKVVNSFQDSKTSQCLYGQRDEGHRKKSQCESNFENEACRSIGQLLIGNATMINI